MEYIITVILDNDEQRPACYLHYFTTLGYKAIPYSFATLDEANACRSWLIGRDYIEPKE